MSNSLSLDIRDALISIVEESTEKTAYYNNAPDSAKYPYSVIEARRTNTGEAIDNYICEVNLWDCHDTYSRVEVMADKLDKKINREIKMLDSCLMIMSGSYRQTVEDPDKSIKRIQDVFNLKIVERN